MADKARVLHVTGGMNVGGIETWIMNVLRRLDWSRVQVDFLVEATGRCAYDDEIEAMGGRILPAPRFRHRLRSAARLAEVLRREGPYRVVHAHGRHDMAVFTAVAAACRVPVRIGHIHNVTDHHTEDAVRRAYRAATRELLLASATWILGCSPACLESLYGPDGFARSDKLQFLPYGIDVDRFSPRDSRAAVAAEFGLPSGARVVGHVGRMAPVKNQALLLDAFAALAGEGPEWFLLLVGDGPLRGDLEARARSLGVADRVRFAGRRSDVPELVSAMDVFVLTSLSEGFGLVLAEAQALGVACVVPDTVPRETDIVPGLVRWMTLADPPAAWAEAIRAMVDHADRPAPADAHALVAASPFNIDECRRVLLSRYYGLVSS